MNILSPFKNIVNAITNRATIDAYDDAERTYNYALAGKKYTPEQGLISTFDVNSEAGIAYIAECEKRLDDADQSMETIFCPE